MSILEILEAHAPAVETVGSEMDEFGRVLDWHDQIICKCGEWPENEAAHRAHVAQVLEQHEREREAAALEEAADEIERLENIGDTAQDELNEEQTAEYWLYHGTPKTTWLRDRAAQIRSQS